MMKSASMLRLLYFFCILLSFKDIFAQTRRNKDAENQSVITKVVFDEPQEIYKLWLGFQPVYSDLFVTNLNIGFGAQANFYWKDKFDLKFQTRKPYSEAFDVSRSQATHSREKDIGGPTAIQNKPAVFNYYEFGGTYHVVDKIVAGKTKFILFEKKESDRVSKVMGNIVVETQVRKIIGVRLGGFYYDTSTDLRKTLIWQNKTLTTDATGPGTFTVTGENGDLFANIKTTAFYLGGSLGRIRHVAVKPEKGYGNLISDLILTSYFDIVYAPSIDIETVVINGNAYKTDGIDRQKLGFRLGLDGHFNRKFAWGYGAEIGHRPTVAKSAFYVAIKIAFPMLGFDLNNQKEAFTK